MKSTIARKACGLIWLTLLLLVVTIPYDACAAETVIVTIKSSTYRSIFPMSINLTHNGVSCGGDNAIEDWAIPAGGTIDQRAFVVQVDDASKVNDFHMVYSASGFLNSIDIDPLVQGREYVLPGAEQKSDTGTVKVTADTTSSHTNSVPTLSLTAMAILALLILLAGTLFFRKANGITMS